MLIVLMVAIVLILVVWGVVQLARRRIGYGLLCLAGALGPVAFIPALLVDAAVRYTSGRRQSAQVSMLAAGVLVVATVALASLAAGSPGALWMGLLGLQMALAVGLFYSAVYAYLGTARISALMALRCLAILALMLGLFKPVLGLAPDLDANRARLPVLVDRSASMNTTDMSHMPNRYVQAVQMLSSQRERIEKYLRPAWLHFAESLQTAASFDALGKLSPTGPGTEGTNIAGAVKRAAGDYPRSDLAGLLVLSDGIHNGSDILRDAAVAAGVPIYTVGIGSKKEALTGLRNLEIHAIDAPLEAVVNNVTTIEVAVRMTGLADIPAKLALVDGETDEEVDARTIRTSKNVAVVTEKLKWTPREPDGAGQGRTSDVYKLRVAVAPNQAENVTDDNSAELHVLLTQPRIRVLCVEGSIRPEYKWLKRLLASDPNIQFMSLVRVHENRFWAQGTIGGKQLNRLPEGDDDFGLFDVMVIGDLDREFLTLRQMARIRKFVNDGGGLLMVGGHSSFGPGGYGGTDIEQVLPVVVGARTQPQEKTPFLPRLTAVGQDHPIFEGIADYFTAPGREEPKEHLPRLPDLRGCVSVVQAKPGASILALHPLARNEVGALVVLAVQQVGGGRSAAFTADTTWQWYLPLRAMGADSPYQRFWGQLIRWLANVETKSREAKPSVLLRLDRSYLKTGDDLRITARVQDAKGRATASAQVNCAIQPVAGARGDETGPESVPLAPTMAGGIFRGQFRTHKEGKYLVKVTATDEGGNKIGDDALGLTVAPHSKEMDRLARQDVTLQLLADRSDGRFRDLAALPDLLDYIVKLQKDRVGLALEPRLVPLFNFPLLFLAFVALLTTEWMLRRSWQLH